MPFHFSLASLLHYRQSLERQHELRLLEIQGTIAKLGTSIEGAERHLAALSRQEKQLLRSGLSGAELQFNQLCRATLRLRLEDLQREGIRLEAVREQCRQAFLQARKQRETVEAIRRQQFEIYRQQETRREQRRLDDAFLLRREFLRRG